MGRRLTRSRRAAIRRSSGASGSGLRRPRIWQASGAFVLDGPLSVAQECRALATLGMAEAEIERDTSGNARPAQARLAAARRRRGGAPARAAVPFGAGRSRLRLASRHYKYNLYRDKLCL